MFRHKNKTYYFRIQIPTDLSPLFANREDFAQSLKTRSKTEASRANAIITESWQSAFFKIRYRLVDPDKIPALVGSLLGARKQLLPKPSLTPSLKAENPPQCHSELLPTGMTLAQLIEIYSAEHATEWTTKTASEFKGLFRLLVRIVGDVPISTIDRKTCIALRDTLLEIPPKHDIAFKYRGLSIADLVALDIKKLKPKTINKHLQLYSGMYRWAVRNRYTEYNPYEGLSIGIDGRATDERQPFDDDDIAKICSVLPPLDREVTSWIPFVAMFSGLRLEEICHLRPKDIISQNGLFLIDINKGVSRLKTKSSVRQVPIHRALVKMGFIEYVRCIPEENNLWGLRSTKYGYGKMYGNKFGRFLRSKAKILDKNKCFHSFRHSFAYKLKTAGVNGKLIAQLMGHADTDISTGRYGADYPVKAAYNAVNEVAYDHEC